MLLSLSQLNILSQMCCPNCLSVPLVFTPTALSHLNRILPFQIGNCFTDWYHNNGATRGSTIKCAHLLNIAAIKGKQRLQSLLGINNVQHFSAEGCFTTHNVDRLLLVEWDLLTFLMYGITVSAMINFVSFSIKLLRYLLLQHCIADVFCLFLLQHFIKASYEFLCLNHLDQQEDRPLKFRLL